MPPTIECVVETGQPMRVATSSQSAAPSSAAIMMNMKSRGLPSIAPRSTMPERTVSVTSPPARIAPLTSNTAATMRACFMLSVPAPTDVPNEFATSLPPMLNAMNMPKMIVVIVRARASGWPMKSNDHSVKITSAAASIAPKVMCHHRSGPKKPAGFSGVVVMGSVSRAIPSPSPRVQEFARHFAPSEQRMGNQWGNVG